MTAADGVARVATAGKFFRCGEEKVFIRGVTYGPFAPDEAGCEYHSPAVARQDFAAIRQAQFDTLRLYTVPPRWLLDEAAAVGLRVMIGLPWEQHVAFLDGGRGRQIRSRLATAVASCAGHPAIFAYAIGNEIPAPVVRWYGHRRVQRYVRDLYDTVKDRDPEALATYVNYPSTEYLDLPFLDFAAFNVYLERERDLRSYVGRLHNIAGDRPLMIAELGLDAVRDGEQAQARVLDAQVRSLAHGGGCAGLFVFSWTDEWYRGGQQITDWGFGLTTRERDPRPALAAVRDALNVPAAEESPEAIGISVVVCTYNGARTIGRCLDALARMRYRRYEVIVVDDGSTDGTHAVAGTRANVRLIRTANHGLSSARNTGWRAARHPVIAYIDDDAWPDADWLTHLARTFAADANHAGVGGPNIPPADDGLVADAVAAAPGGPIHVLLTDDVAEHIPGCNMAFRRERLEAVGGFDPRFRTAGDDVDLCWRMQERGWTLGFNPAAMVWHRRRDRVGAYLRQQLNYGRAEADLEQKWPEKYNAAGHLTWSGRMYHQGATTALGWWTRRRIYHGIWGSALFQSVYHGPPSWVWSVPTMPEWYMLAAVLAAVALGGLAWAPLAWALPLLCTLVLATVAQAAAASRRSLAARRTGPRHQRARLLLLATSLHLMQPVARLWGRLGRGLTPWRRRGASGGFCLPLPRTERTWSDAPADWASPEDRLAVLKAALVRRGAIVSCGGSYDRWDVESRGGVLASARIRLLAEEHGQGRQLVRLRVWPHVSAWALAATCAAAALAGACAAAGGGLAALIVIVAPGVLVAGRAVYESSRAMAAVTSAAHDRPTAAGLETASCVTRVTSAPVPRPTSGAPNDSLWTDPDEVEALNF